MTKNCETPSHKNLKPKQTDRFLKKLFRKKFNQPLSDKKERNIINAQSRILDATGPLAILWSEAEKLRKRHRGLDPVDVINIVQRAIVLIGNTHYVYMSDRRRSMLARLLPDCTDLLSESDAKKALLKSKGDLFGRKFRKMLTLESKDNKELYDMLPSHKRRNDNYSSNSSNFRRQNSGGQSSSTKQHNGSQQPFRQGPPNRQFGGRRGNQDRNWGYNQTNKRGRK